MHVVQPCGRVDVKLLFAIVRLQSGAHSAAPNESLIPGKPEQEAVFVSNINMGLLFAIANWEKLT